MGETITIPVEEYKKLLEVSIRIGIFSDFVNRSKYSVGREDCGRYLGFPIIERED